MRKMLGCVLALIVAVGARAADEPATIVEKAIKAHGGKEKLGKVKAEQWKGKGVMTMGDQKMPYTISYAFQQPNQFRFDVTAEIGGNKMEFTAATDGKQAWEKGMGMVREMEKVKSEEFKHNVYAMHLGQLLPLTEKTYTLTAAGETKVNDKPAVGVKVSAKDRRDVTLYFDKESGLLVKMATIIKNEFDEWKEVPQEVLYLDYKEKDGSKHFNKLVIRRDGKTFLEEEFSEQKTAEKLDPKLFEKP